jgi:membrane protein implicated in regulation of membrane protease activity
MEILGLALADFFLYSLIISGILTFFFILFNDIFAGFDLPDFLNPTLILSFLTIASGSGYVLISLTSFGALPVFLISFVIAFILVTIINLFILVPISTAHESLTITEEDIKGRLGTVITSVPIDGYGEVLITSKSGTFSKPAVSFDREAIPSETKVLIIDIQNGVLQVSPHEEINELG